MLTDTAEYDRPAVCDPNPLQDSKTPSRITAKDLAFVRPLEYLDASVLLVQFQVWI
jgi:hypothetical protein